MSDQQSKNYAQGAFVYENKIEGRNGTFITYTIKGEARQFCEWLMSIADDQGQFRMTMQERRTREKRKPTHNLFQDTWKANRDANPQPARTHEQQTQNYQQQPTSTDNLPF